MAGQTMVEPATVQEEAVGDLEAFLRRYLVVSDAQAVALALWTAHTHAFEAANLTPYIAVTSPTMRSGKSRLFEVLELLVREPAFVSSITPAALYRTIAERRPTLLLDEVDAKGISERLRGILNDGYRRGGKVTLVAGDFPTFCPKAFAGIGTPLPHTVMDRSIPIRLQRKAPDEHVVRFRRADAEEQARPIREKLTFFSQRVVVDLLASYTPDIPPGLNDRAADVWEPLLAIADLVGWSDRARESAIALSGGQEEQDRGVQVLADIQVVFTKIGAARIATANLLAALQGLDAPAFEDDYRRVTGADLARHLRAFDIRPKVMRIGAETSRGYERRAFEDAWRRYVPSHGVVM